MRSWSPWSGLSNQMPDFAKNNAASVTVKVNAGIRITTKGEIFGLSWPRYQTVTW